MVDYLPWEGNYTNTVVRNNNIVGGFANEPADGNDTKGVNDDDVEWVIGLQTPDVRRGDVSYLSGAGSSESGGSMCCEGVGT